MPISTNLSDYSVKPGAEPTIGRASCFRQISYPQQLNPLPYLSAASELEQTGKLASARAAYQTALNQWPEQPAARFGLGNIAWAQGGREEAVRQFLQVTREHPELKAGWNNLAVGLDALDCSDSAEQARDCGTSMTPCSSHFQDTLVVKCPALGHE